MYFKVVYHVSWVSLARLAPMFVTGNSNSHAKSEINFSIRRNYLQLSFSMARRLLEPLMDVENIFSSAVSRFQGLAAAAHDNLSRSVAHLSMMLGDAASSSQPPPHDWKLRP